MTIRVVNVNPTDPRPERVEQAVQALRAGEIVVVPTETFYGLAADPFNAEALRRLNKLKGKPEDSPALLLLSGMEQVPQVATNLPDSFHVLADTFWPGPLTLVVPASGEIPTDLSGGRGTVALRVPGLSLPRRLAAAFGRPVTGVSANTHGEPPSRTAVDAVRSLPEEIGLVLDGGSAPGGTPSTIVDLSETPPRVLRVGTVPTSSLEPFIPGVIPAPGPRNV
jgi:L-threonylcarbamoyladenylate synthase